MFVAIKPTAHKMSEIGASVHKKTVYSFRRSYGLNGKLMRVREMEQEKKLTDITMALKAYAIRWNY